MSVVDRQYIREEIRMGEKASFFVLRAKAVPEVLLRVVEAKRLLDSGKDVFWQRESLLMIYQIM